MFFLPKQFFLIVKLNLFSSSSSSCLEKLLHPGLLLWYFMDLLEQGGLTAFVPRAYLSTEEVDWNLEFGSWEATEILSPAEDGADGSLARWMRSTLELKSELSSRNAGLRNCNCEWTDVRFLKDILLLLLLHFHRPAPPTLRAQPSTKYYIGLSRNRTGDLSISRRPLNEPMWVLFSPVATMNFWSQCCTFQYLISLLQVATRWTPGSSGPHVPFTPILCDAAFLLLLLLFLFFEAACRLPGIISENEH